MEKLSMDRKIKPSKVSSRQPPFAERERLHGTATEICQHPTQHLSSSFFKSQSLLVSHFQEYCLPYKTILSWVNNITDLLNMLVNFIINLNSYNFCHNNYTDLKYKATISTKLIAITFEIIASKEFIKTSTPLREVYKLLNDLKWSIQIGQLKHSIV